MQPCVEFLVNKRMKTIKRKTILLICFIILSGFYVIGLLTR
jgi:hypothetical protein